MNADAFRYLYDYHFSENRKLLAYAAQLSIAQLTQPHPYSLGSVRDHLVHLMSVDDGWFGALRGAPPSAWLVAADFTDCDAIQAHWVGVEARMRGFLATLRDDQLTHLLADEDGDLPYWRVLLHVANHGTDHRAQALRLIHDHGIKTGPQDLVFYAYDHP
jgi:uncharacterized damage-inducible protein DinB